MYLQGKGLLGKHLHRHQNKLYGLDTAASNMMVHTLAVCGS